MFAPAKGADVRLLRTTPVTVPPETRDTVPRFLICPEDTLMLESVQSSAKVGFLTTRS